MLESRSRLLKNELDSLKRKVSMGCDMDIAGRKVANADGKVNILVNGLRRDTFDSYASIQHNVDQTLLAVGRCLRDLFDSQAQGFQRSI